MTKILMLIKNDLLCLGVVSCLKDKVKDADFQHVNTWENLQSMLMKEVFNLLIIDSNISDFTNVTTLSRIRRQHPSLKTIVLGDEDYNPVTIAFLKKGVEGVCMKSITQHDFIHAYATIMQGKKYLDHTMAEYLLSDLTTENRIGTLSARESQITTLLVQGLRTADISKQLNLAVSTVSTIKSNIYRKMRVNNVVDLAGRVELSRKRPQSLSNTSSSL